MLSPLIVIRLSLQIFTDWRTVLIWCGDNSVLKGMRNSFKQNKFGGEGGGVLHLEICSRVLPLSLEHSVVNHTCKLQFLSWNEASKFFVRFNNYYIDGTSYWIRFEPWSIQKLWRNSLRSNSSNLLLPLLYYIQFLIGLFLERGQIICHNYEICKDVCE